MSGRDGAISHVAAPARTGMMGKLAEQPQLVAVSVGTIAIGLAARRPDLVRGGGRMLAAQVASAVVRSAVRHRIGRSPSLAAPAGEAGNRLAGLVAAGVAAWVAEAVVGAVFDRIEPKIEQAIAARKG